MNIGFQ